MKNCALLVSRIGLVLRSPKVLRRTIMNSTFADVNGEHFFVFVIWKKKSSSISETWHRNGLLRSCKMFVSFFSRWFILFIQLVMLFSYLFSSNFLFISNYILFCLAEKNRQLMDRRYRTEIKSQPLKKRCTEKFKLLQQLWHLHSLFFFKSNFLIDSFAIFHAKHSLEWDCELERNISPTQKHKLRESNITLQKWEIVFNISFFVDEKV